MENFRHCRNGTGSCLGACRSSRVITAGTNYCSLRPPTCRTTRSARSLLARSWRDQCVRGGLPLSDMLPESDEWKPRTPAPPLPTILVVLPATVQLAGGTGADLLLTANARTMTTAEEKGLAGVGQLHLEYPGVGCSTEISTGQHGGCTSTDGRKLVVCAEEVPCVVPPPSSLVWESPKRRSPKSSR